MGELIELASARRGAASPREPGLVPETFFFDLASPETYLVAERVERRFATATWRPALLRLPAEAPPADGDEGLARVERRAHELRMPLVWPERYPAPVVRAMRVAVHATARGRGSQFTIAAGRLAFCGGFDIEEPRILAEAAAAAGLDVDAALGAADDGRHDRALEVAGRSLRVAGGAELPALSRGGQIVCGEARIAAVALMPFAATAPHARI
jgi:2-hydroxychromene-2-carboxylate isomerase